ncbi:hypothetical protein F01_480007 [Burkholderia cenocepacia]|nr:hypothetical protein F01_480007 [Burkholderia cenocepacia]
MPNAKPMRSSRGRRRRRGPAMRRCRCPASRKRRAAPHAARPGFRSTAQRGGRFARARRPSGSTRPSSMRGRSAARRPHELAGGEGARRGNCVSACAARYGRRSTVLQRGGLAARRRDVRLPVARVAVPACRRRESPGVRRGGDGAVLVCAAHAHRLARGLLRNAGRRARGCGRAVRLVPQRVSRGAAGRAAEAQGAGGVEDGIEGGAEACSETGAQKGIHASGEIRIETGVGAESETGIEIIIRAGTETGSEAQADVIPAAWRDSLARFAFLSFRPPRRGRPARRAGDWPARSGA